MASLITPTYRRDGGIPATTQLGPNTSSRLAWPSGKHRAGPARPSPRCLALRGGSHPALLRLLPAGCPPDVLHVAVLNASLPRRRGRRSCRLSPSVPRRCRGWIRPFLLAEPQRRWQHHKPCRRAALALSLRLTCWDLSKRFRRAPVPQRRAPTGPPRAAGWGRRGLPPSRGSEAPRKPHKPLRGNMWWRQNHHPVGSSETKRDLYRHNKDIKAKERTNKQKKKTVPRVGGGRTKTKPSLHHKRVKKRNQRR